LVPTGMSTAAYDPTLGISTLQFSAGAGGYGFDTGNTFHLDNFTVSTVPEPVSMGLLGLAGLASLRRRRA
jgi:MYXO-CTERM domain-containing protein